MATFSCILSCASTSALIFYFVFLCLCGSFILCVLCVSDLCCRSSLTVRPEWAEAHHQEEWMVSHEPGLKSGPEIWSWMPLRFGILHRTGYHPVLQLIFAFLRESFGCSGSRWLASMLSSDARILHMFANKFYNTT